MARPTKEEVAAYNKAYRAANREKIAAKKKAYRGAHAAEIARYLKEYYAEYKDKIKEQKQTYNLTHSEKLAARKRAYHEAHREEMNAKGKRWVAANRDRARVNGHNHRARTRNGGKHTITEWHALCLWFGSVCLRCGASDNLSVDHVVPVIKGGTNDISNLQPLCRSCNSSKKSKHIDYRDPAILAAFLESLKED